MSTKGPQTTSVGGGRAHTGRGEGGGACINFLEDFCGCGAANLTERFFLSFFGGLDFFLVSLGAATSSSSSVSYTHLTLPTNREV